MSGQRYAYAIAEVLGLFREYLVQSAGSLSKLRAGEVDYVRSEVAYFAGMKQGLDWRQAVRTRPVSFGATLTGSPHDKTRLHNKWTTDIIYQRLSSSPRGDAKNTASMSYAASDRRSGRRQASRLHCPDGILKQANNKVPRKPSGPFPRDGTASSRAITLEAIA